MESVSPEFLWVFLGILLIMAEFVLPGLIVIFFGLGALITGLLIWAGMPGEGAWPFIVFPVVSVSALLLLRGFFKPWFAGHSLSAQSTGADEDFIGHRARVVSGFNDAQGVTGRVAYRGANWDAQAARDQAFKVGDQVRIVGREGSILTIDKE